MMAEAPSNAKRNILLGLLLVAMAVSMAILLILLVQGLNLPAPPPPKPVPPPATRVEQSTTVKYGGLYYYAGMPRPTEPVPITVLTNIGFATGFSEQRKAPVWTCYRLFRVDSMDAPPRPQKFEADMRTRARIVTSDYSGSGYDRGHCAPNYGIAICYGREAQLETFRLSNILPEKPKLNRQVWEHLEEKEVRNYAQQMEEVWVVTGGVFDTNPATLKHAVHVPRACFKVIVDAGKGKPRILAFLIPQDVTGTESPGTYLTSVDEVEKESGLDLFSELPDDLENRLESETAKEMW